MNSAENFDREDLSRHKQDRSVTVLPLGHNRRERTTAGSVGPFITSVSGDWLLSRVLKNPKHYIIF